MSDGLQKTIAKIRLLEALMGHPCVLSKPRERRGMTFADYLVQHRPVPLAVTLHIGPLAVKLAWNPQPPRREAPCTLDAAHKVLARHGNAVVIHEESERSISGGGVDPESPECWYEEMLRFVADAIGSRDDDRTLVKAFCERWSKARQRLPCWICDAAETVRALAADGNVDAVGEIIARRRAKEVSRGVKTNAMALFEVDADLWLEEAKERQRYLDPAVPFREKVQGSYDRGVCLVIPGDQPPQRLYNFLLLCECFPRRDREKELVSVLTALGYAKSFLIGADVTSVAGHLADSGQIDAILLDSRGNVKSSLIDAAVSAAQKRVGRAPPVFSGVYPDGGPYFKQVFTAFLREHCPLS